jgi:beta-phosphoglucomutase
MPLTGGIFDIDGVLLDTPHERAWRETLQRLMAGPWRTLAPRTGYAPDGFTSHVYQAYVAGKPRLAGAQAALAYFRIPDPDGRRARRYATEKEARVVELAHRGGFRVFDDALRFLLRAKAAGTKVAAASSSKNADTFLGAVPIGTFGARLGRHYPFVRPDSTLLQMFDADVDGLDAGPGKPDPGIFLAAAAALHLPPAACFVVEDAPAGIQAAKAGGMYGIGVARAREEALLRAAGADAVVTSLDNLAVEPLLAAA